MDCKTLDLAEQVAIHWLPIDDLEHCLLPEEHSAIAHAALKRRREFASGRVAARSALNALAVNDTGAIGVGPERAPQWPAHTVGSISHSRGLAIAAASRSARYRGLGIDIEERGRLKTDLISAILTDREQEELTDLDPTLPFCAKEAAYKLLQPLLGHFIGFQEMEFTPLAESGRFSLRHVGDKPGVALVNAARGYYRPLEDCWLTVVTLDA